MEDTLACDKCNGDVIRFVASAEQFTKTRKEYGGTVREVGERVRVRTGWRCICTYWLGDIPSEAGRHVKADSWPSHWLDEEE